ncbi:UrcA family protein [Phenylobacterium sp.]|jgi:UrcA family protein|uniref:UrcA family protein n=1 Tax=Phenylobacterium sp. TaxID=1871053 RepID=UPI002F932C4F
MFSFTARIAGAATLALAVLPVGALATSAQAAPAAVQVRDLDLNTTAGQRAFQQRTEQAARAFCRTRTNPGSMTRMGRVCIAAVTVEMNEKLAVVQQARRAQPEVYAAR